MAESKFTKGPWGFQESEAYKDTWWVTAGENRLARVCGSPTDTKANAELMADAPRMLEALRALCTHAGIPQDGTQDVAQAAFDEADALLEKHGG